MAETTSESAAKEPASEASAAPETPPLKTTPLHDAHVALGARMVPFAGYDMPVQYPSGILGEHLHTRSSAGIFDVSHMGQAFLMGPDHATVAKALETLVPADILNLAPGRQRYTQLLNEEGGILDDLMVTRSADEAEDGVLMLVVNAACKEQDFPHIAARLPENMRLMRAEHRALIALQGPKAAEVLDRHCGGAAVMPFMSARQMSFDGLACHVSRSGYTGEDGYEISIKSAHAVAVWSAL
ncbi:MAG: glycine cleavage system protein T, partial [Hyphomicrobiales bacterium]|nr:glycine cleavage system protein T [Hyphomicrobiales bacterium]